MRLSGLQNPQAARPVAPVSTARPGNIPGWRLTPYPGYEIARPTHSQPPSGRFPGGGAMRLSGLQNPQAAPTCSPGKHSATGEHSRVAADALPGLQNPQAAPTCSPGKHSATGEHSRVAADALPGLHAHNRHRAGSPEGKSGCLAGGNEYTRRAPRSGALSHNSA